jgi:hypothetical protein
MLSAHREVKVAGRKVAETPMLVPSFSSKGFPDVDNIVKVLAPSITDSALFSAFDIHHNLIKEVPDIPELLILDSGGYETSTHTELSDTRMYNYSEIAWTVDELRSVLDNWTAEQPTLAVSFDHSSQAYDLKVQIDNARQLFAGRKFGRELLIKPEPAKRKGQMEGTRRSRVDIANVVAHIHELRDFDVIGFTEKELGYSIFDRMCNIKKVREALTHIGLSTPIHIFGSLDTISTPLYFLSGADIFDGLTWLRYGYATGLSIYTRNAAVVKYGNLRMNDDDIDGHIWYDNYQAMLDLEYSLRRHVAEGTFECFGQHGPMFEKAHKELLATRKG